MVGDITIREDDDPFEDCASVETGVIAAVIIRPHAGTAGVFTIFPRVRMRALPSDPLPYSRRLLQTRECS